MIQANLQYLIYCGGPCMQQSSLVICLTPNCPRGLWIPHFVAFVSFNNRNLRDENTKAGILLFGLSNCQMLLKLRELTCWPPSGRNDNCLNSLFFCQKHRFVPTVLMIWCKFTFHCLKILKSQLCVHLFSEVTTRTYPYFKTLAYSIPYPALEFKKYGVVFEG